MRTILNIKENSTLSQAVFYKNDLCFLSTDYKEKIGVLSKF